MCRGGNPFATGIALPRHRDAGGPGQSAEVGSAPPLPGGAAAPARVPGASAEQAGVVEFGGGAAAAVLLP